MTLGQVFPVQNSTAGDERAMVIQGFDGTRMRVIQTSTGGIASVQPVDASGVVLFSTSNPANVQLQGRKAAPQTVAADSSATVNASGGTNEQTITPTSGHMARLTNLYVAIPAIAGSTGNHAIAVYRGTSIARTGAAIVTRAATSTLTIQANVLLAGTFTAPLTADQLQRNLLGLWFDGTVSLVIRYTNDSDTNQTGARSIQATYVEEAIV
ncbi:hypothetical protein [Microbacterium sp.]|uniref:hypothetical protein n=1 Tax=Microbacterium sp. TaxID=51671 RepID=UPI0027342A44|nr:hypothetical protein [Microbacterium sp.]MDP3949921.1 hypothetical protein [Microbacterium sp.]